jgi:hypothetical protein
LWKRGNDGFEREEAMERELERYGDERNHLIERVMDIRFFRYV